MEASYRVLYVWQASRSYQNKPGTDLSGLIATILVVKTPALPADISAFLPRPSIAGNAVSTPTIRPIKH